MATFDSLRIDHDRKVKADLESIESQKKQGDAYIAAEKANL